MTDEMRILAPEAAKAGRHGDLPSYEAMHACSTSGPDDFWREQVGRLCHSVDVGR
jgi:hypothetical protein